MISVYNSNERLFDHNGIKILNPLKAIVRKEDNRSLLPRFKRYN